MDYFCITGRDGLSSSAVIDDSDEERIRNGIILIKNGDTRQVWKICNYAVESCPQELVMFICSPCKFVCHVGTEKENGNYIMFKKRDDDIEALPIVVLGVVEVKGNACAFFFDLNQKSSGYICADSIDSEDSDLFLLMQKMWTLGEGVENER